MASPFTAAWTLLKQEGPYITWMTPEKRAGWVDGRGPYDSASIYDFLKRDGTWDSRIESVSESQHDEADIIEAPSSTDDEPPPPRGPSPPRSDDPPNPFQKAWSTLKALPENSIRETQSYTDEFDKNPSMATAHPIIDRLIRDRDEAEYRARVDPKGRSLAESPSNYGLEGELPEWANPHVRQREYGTDAGVPYTPPLIHSAEQLRRLESTHKEPAGYANFGPTGTLGSEGMTMDESRAANAARGVERGDRFSGDYVVNAPGQDMYGSKPRRTGENRAFPNFPYGARAGGHRGPMNVEPDSPMAQMYNMAPQLRQLPEGLQPEWMDEFRKAPMAKAWSLLKYD